MEVKEKEPILHENKDNILEEKVENKDKLVGPYEKVKLARDAERPRALDFIENLFDDIVFLRGDRCFGDSKSILGGIASFKGIPITFIGIQKGSGMEEALETDFGMPKPEGYRKAIRLMEQADKFKRPVVTFVDTPGAYPGIDAEERGVFQAIAEILATGSKVGVPIISFIIGEGGSGGALALAVANRLYMLENSVFSILSPEGFASILWKDSALASKAANLMKLTSEDLLKGKIIDDIIWELDKEKIGGIAGIETALERDLHELKKKNRNLLKKERFEKYRKIGV